jgi:hypothetical protein
MNSFVSVTWADTTNDYQVVLAETAAQIQQLDTNPGLSSSFSIIGLVRCKATVPANYYNTFYQNVQKQLADCGGQLTTTRYTDYSKLILSVTAVGKDAQNVGGYNLLSYLSNYNNVSKQGINGAIWALIAVNAKSTYDFPIAKGVAVQTTRTLLIDKILATELKTGGFTLYGSQADIDMTAMAVQALAPYYNSRADVKAAIDRALSLFSAKQSSTGAYQSGGIYNAESTAQVLTALSVLSINATTDGRFVKGSQNVLTGLLSYYLGSGSFSHTTGGSSNPLATQQSFYALAAYDCFQEGGKLYDMENIPSNPNINNNTNVTPTKPTNPITPSKPTKPTNPVKPTNPATPTNSTTPTNSVASTEEEAPATSVTPNQEEISEVSASQTDKEAQSESLVTTSNVKAVSASKPETLNPQIDKTNNSMIIAKDTFAGLQGKDSNYKIDGTTSDGNGYSWTFHGTDIKTPMDFDGTLVLGGMYENQINQLAAGPFIFTVGQQEFPGEALLTMTTGLADGSYGLFSYDVSTQTAKLLQKVKVDGGQVKCILSKGGNYYIAQKSMAALAKEQEAASKSETNTVVINHPETDDSESKFIITKAIILTFVMATLTGVFAIVVNRVPESTDKESEYEEDEYKK